MSDSKKINKDTFPNQKLVVTHPLIAMLPDYLKDPANFKEIEKLILNTFISKCDHSDMLEWSKCSECTDKMLQRRLILKRLGFKNARQYMLWKKIHKQIIERFPLIDWKKENEVRRQLDLKK